MTRSITDAGRKAFEVNTLHLLAASHHCVSNTQVVPALVLIYSTIDSMAALLRPPHEAESTQRHFIAWVEQYLLPHGGLACTPRELYAARCGVLHASSSDSSLSRTKGVRRILYAFGEASSAALQSNADRLYGHGKCNATHLSDLHAALEQGIQRMRDAMARDAGFSTRVLTNASRMFGYVPSPVIINFNA